MGYFEVTYAFPTLALAGVAGSTLAWMLYAWRSPQDDPGAARQSSRSGGT